MKKRIAIFYLLVFSNIAVAQSKFQKEFNKHFENKDSGKLSTILIEWEKENPNDPEFYTAAFNFHYSNSRPAMLSLEKGDTSKDGYKLTKQDSGEAFYLTSNTDYDINELNKGIQYIDKGIAKFPNRLDMRFGKCYVFGQVGDYPNFTKTIIETVEYSTINKNNWLWTNNEKKEDAENFMLGTIQAYLKQLYDTENDDLLPNMIEIGEATLKHYPNYVEILSTTSIALLLTKQYDKAITYLKHAEQVNPKDFIVLNNIAHGYKLKGDKANAIKYYELTDLYGDQEAKAQAKAIIAELKK
jgi:hypothetical protein